MDSPPPSPEPAAEHASAPLELPAPEPRTTSVLVGRDLYRSANRRLVFGPLCASGGALAGMAAMGVWSVDSFSDTRFESSVIAVGAEGLAASGFALLASGVQMQRRAQMSFGHEPVANPYYTAGLALGGGALVLGALSPGALATESKPYIYVTTGGAAALGVGGLATMFVANWVELKRTRPLRVTLDVSPGGLTATW